MPRKFSKVFVVANENCERLSTIRLANGMRLAVCLHWRHVFSLAQTHTHTHTFSLSLSLSRSRSLTHSPSFSMYMPMNFPFPSDLPSISLFLWLAFPFSHIFFFRLFVCMFLHPSFYSVIRLLICFLIRSLFLPISFALSLFYHSLTFFPSLILVLCLYVCWCSFGLHFIYFPSSIRRTEIRRRISSCHRKWYKIHEVLALLDIHT